MLQPGAVPHVKIVAGNKCDLANSRQVSSQEGLAWARSHDCGYVSDFLTADWRKRAVFVVGQLQGVLECSLWESPLSREE